MFCALLLLQYPFVFALERGNTDTVNVLLYTVAAVLFVRRRILLAGVAAGLAAGFKLSPIIAIVVMTGALVLARAQVGRWAWLRFGGGALGAFALTLVVFFSEAKRYLLDVLPKYADTITVTREWSHSIPTFVGAYHDNSDVPGRLPGRGLGVGRGQSARARRRRDGARGITRGVDVHSAHELRLQPHQHVSAVTAAVPARAADEPLGVAGVRPVRRRRRPAPVRHSRRKIFTPVFTWRSSSRSSSSRRWSPRIPTRRGGAPQPT